MHQIIPWNLLFYSVETAGRRSVCSIITIINSELLFMSTPYYRGQTNQTTSNTSKMYRNFNGNGGNRNGQAEETSLSLMEMENNQRWVKRVGRAGESAAKSEQRHPSRSEQSKSVAGQHESRLFLHVRSLQVHNGQVRCHAQQLLFQAHVLLDRLRGDGFSFGLLYDGSSLLLDLNAHRFPFLLALV
eukprot:scaffold14385_cov229-Ochromonas_danica.AAC.3